MNVDTIVKESFALIIVIAITAAIVDFCPTSS